MALETRVKFYYGHVVTSSNNQIPFDEGSGEIIATLRNGKYSLTEYVNEISTQLNLTGSLVYTVSVNRDTRLITIAASGNFDLLFSTGATAASSIRTLSGFGSTDFTGAATYTGASASGSEYRPQFFLDKYLASENNRKRISSSLSESTTGKTETFSFGDTSEVAFNLTFINNFNHGKGSVIEKNVTGVEDALDFMQAITDKQRIEFMPDRDNSSAFEKLLLLSTIESSKGVDYILKELTTKKLPNYYETGRLTFRVI